MSTAAIIGGSLAGAGIGAAGSAAAAGAQSGAAKSAAGLQYKLGEDQLTFNKQQYADAIARLAPWLRAGTSSINTLADLLKTPGQGLLTPWTGTFNAPTAAEARATPGYVFTAGAGTGAIENSAAAGGNLLSTGTLKSLAQYNQGLADTTYQQTYQNAFNQYLQQYNQFQNNQTNEFNRLAAASGIGQTAATNLNATGTSTAAIGGNIAGTTGSNVGNSILYGGAATASGYAGIANALSGGIGNIGQYMLLRNLFGQGNNPFQDVTPSYLPGPDFGAPTSSGVPT